MRSGNFTAAGFWIIDIICALLLAYILNIKKKRGTETFETPIANGTRDESLENIEPIDKKITIEPRISEA